MTPELQTYRPVERRPLQHHEDHGCRVVVDAAAVDDAETLDRVVRVLAAILEDELRRVG